MTRDETNYELYKALGKISFDYRQAIVLRKIEGVLIKETADILGWNESKVKNATERGMKKLQQLLGGKTVHDLEKRLNNIPKVEVTEQQMKRAKSLIINQSNNKTIAILPSVVTTLMLAVLCFLIFVPISNETERASSIFTDEINEIQFIRTNYPAINYRVDSFNYIIVKKIIEDKEKVNEFQMYLKQHLVNQEPYDHKIEGNYVYDFAFIMESGEVVYLKYDPLGSTSGTFYDVRAKVMYKVENYSDLDPLHDLIGDAKIDWDSTYVLLILIVILFTIGILNHKYRVKYDILDERGKRQYLRGWKFFIPYLIFIVAFSIMSTIFGTLHLGIIILLIELYLLVIAKLEIKYGIVRPNDVHFKYIIPFSCGVAIIDFLLILVV